jgi:hypothetical protein
VCLPGDCSITAVSGGMTMRLLRQSIASIGAAIVAALLSVSVANADSASDNTSARNWDEVFAQVLPDQKKVSVTHQIDKGRRLPARRATAGRSPVDPDHAAVHRRRHRCPAQARCDDLEAWAGRLHFAILRTASRNAPKFARRKAPRSTTRSG